MIVIDGLGATGKTTIAQALASRMNYDYISTGFIYKALAYNVMRYGIDENDVEKIVFVAETMNINFIKGRIYLEGCDITDDINLPKIVPLTTKISLYPQIRKVLLNIQRKSVKYDNIILDGRDMGSVVFPDAEWKFMIVADFNIRLKRMHMLMTLEERKVFPTPESYSNILKEIDEQCGDIVIPNDAIIYDNSYSPSPEQDAIILEYYITHWDEIGKNNQRRKGVKI